MSTSFQTTQEILMPGLGLSTLHCCEGHGNEGLYCHQAHEGTKMGNGQVKGEIETGSNFSDARVPLMNLITGIY